MESTKPYGEGSGMILRICGKIMTKLDILIPMEEKKGQKKKLKVKISYDGPVEAPIKKDQIIAKLRIIYDEDLIGEYDLLSLNVFVYGDI